MIQSQVIRPRDHASLAALLSLDEYFPEEAVSAGAFDIVGEGERWSFSRYLQDALRTVLFGGSQ